MAPQAPQSIDSISPISQTKNIKTMNPAVNKLLNAPHMKTVLKHLGIKQSQIQNVKQVVNPASQVTNVKFVQMSDTNLVAGVLQAQEEEFKKIKKKLKEIEESTFDKKAIKQLCELLDIPYNEENLVILSEEGKGFLLIQEALKKLEGE